MILVHLELQLRKKNMNLSELSEAVGISLTNMSLLKTTKVKGLRFETLNKICKVLDCKPGDILEYIPDED